MFFRFNVLQLVFLLFCLGCGGLLRAQAGDATIAGDTTVYENQPDNNGGLDSEVCIGNLAVTTSTRRGFIRYALPAMPAGATIERVVLNLLQDRVRTNGGPLGATLELRRVTADWVEGAGSGPPGGPCGGGSAVPGLDWATQPTVAAFPSGIRSLPTTNLFVVTLDTDIGTANDGLIGDVQAWVDNGATNFGWRLAVQEEGTANNARAIVPIGLTIHWSDPGDIIFGSGFEPPP